MYGEKALELIKELQRSKGRHIPSYNDDIIRQVLEEMKILFEENQSDVKLAIGGAEEYYPTIQIRHAALERNKRCLLTYLYNRLQILQEMRWKLGSILPAETKFNLSLQEVNWFQKYNKILVNYMRSIGEECQMGGLDITQDLTPPKSLYIEVRCMQDYGEFETEDGCIVQFKKNSQHFLLRTECEQLIRQGILEHVIN